MDTTPHVTTESGGRDALRQWIGVLGAPVIWLVHFQANYALASRTCRWMTVLPLHIVSGTALVLIIVVGAIAWRVFESAPDEPGGNVPALSAGRIRLMGVVGLMSAILFFLVVVAQWLPTWTADPCQR